MVLEGIVTVLYSWAMPQLGNSAIEEEAISGLEWDGNEETNTQRVLRWLSPFAIYPATYIWKSYRKGPKTGSNPHYWTEFFWGNYGDFTWGAAGTFYGGHPYPFDGTGASTGQRDEISVFFNDIDSGATPVWDTWKQRVFRAWRESAALTHHEYFYDWDLFVSSGGTQGFMAYTVNNTGWADTNPPTPSIVFGEAPPNNSNTASWGGYNGREQFKGIQRGYQLYDTLLGSAAAATVANTADIASEIAIPGSIIQPWYLRPNPRPNDVADQSGSGNHPSFPASLPSLWTP